MPNEGDTVSPDHRKGGRFNRADATVLDPTSDGATWMNGIDLENETEVREQGLAGVVYRFERVWRAVAAIFMFAIMVIIVVDVASRYLLNSPLPWAFDVVSMYLMTGLFFLMLSDTLRVNVHVRVDMLYVKASPRARCLMDLATSLLALGVFAGILYTSVCTTWNSWSAGDVVTGAIPWPVWLSHAFIPLGISLLVARLLADVASNVALLVGRHHRDT